MPGFFPPEYKTFTFRPGDVFADREQGKYGLMRILTVDHVDIAKGEAINIAGQRFTSTEDDYLLIIGCALGPPQFQSIDEAVLALSQGLWLPQIEHAPMRATCVTEAQILLLNIPVRDNELRGYNEWRQQYVTGQASVF